MKTSALRNGNFRLLWTSSAISGVGSWLLVVAIPFHVFQLTGSAAATGFTLAVEALPALLVGPWAGVLLDRWNLPRAMWLADLASAAAVSLILVADSADRVWFVYVAVLAENLATTVFRPAARALTPSIVGTGSQLAGANALNALSGSLLRLAAPPLGALLLAGPGIHAVLVIDIGSYLGGRAARRAGIRSRLSHLRAWSRRSARRPDQRESPYLVGNTKPRQHHPAGNQLGVLRSGQRAWPDRGCRRHGIDRDPGELADDLRRDHPAAGLTTGVSRGSARSSSRWTPSP